MTAVWMTASRAYEHVISCGSPDAGPVMHGLDLVATRGAAMNGSLPVFGRQDINYTDAEGFVYLFTSSSHRDEFLANPDDYRVGAAGYCGFAVTGNDKGCNPPYEPCNGGVCLDSPDTFMIQPTNNMLYFFLSPHARRLFVGKDDGALSARQAEANVAIAGVVHQVRNCINTDVFTNTNCDNY
eukprot:CAMPEP_0119125394 /NCGR_PEP_ID=MMETSP1310-20130426/4681_1 /TAXON_ID=464262 /ORGANISM="Genus nov. species nov., Strain RCC2339" /LENGTH=182 /DNA_ID=CAMNT_0007115455 /DNA_START=145 /DNA_END=693 /DNA_ORIENTATION=+